MLTVIQPGLLTTLQDAGRHGSARLGIGTSGAADGPALRLANALVGNPASCCALEMTWNGPTLETGRDLLVALTGAPLPRARIDDAPLPMWRPVRVQAGSRLAPGAMEQGCRSYLAVAGGIDVPPWHGSRSTDVNAGLGPVPRPLAAGDTLRTGNAPAAAFDDAAWSLDPRPWFDASSPRVVRLVPGSHAERLDAASRKALTDARFRIGKDSNRVGLRLDGPRLALSAPLELVSEGAVAGTVQLPPDGRPIVLGPEHPVTGGYPRIGQVAAVDLPLLAQCRPGDTVVFRWIDLGQAASMLAEREAALERLVGEIGKRLENDA